MRLSITSVYTAFITLYLAQLLQTASSFRCKPLTRYTQSFPRSIQYDQKCRYGSCQCSSAIAAGIGPNEAADVANPRPEAGVLQKLFLFGASVGPLVDALHNQAILRYDILPLQIDLPWHQSVKTSLLVVPLLGVAYAVMGAVLPWIIRSLLSTEHKQQRQHETATPSLVSSIRGQSPQRRAAAAVLSTASLIKLSEAFVVSSASHTIALPVMYLLALLQWWLLDGEIASLFIAALLSISGPLAELPFMAAGAWHYLQPDYWPLAAFGFGPQHPHIAWAGLLAITGPCYFAVATDAIAVGRYFSSVTSGNSNEKK